MGFLLGGFAGLMAAGVPIGFVILAAGLLYITFATEVAPTIVVQRLLAGVDDFTLLAIPLFLFAGFLMNEAGMTERLVIFARVLLRRVYASLAQVGVFVSMIFGGVSGAAAADLSAVGTVLLPQMKKAGYPPDFSAAMVLSASFMGAILPPSIPFIIYGVQAETSISTMFIAGIVPGIAMAAVLLVTNVILLKRRGFTAPAEEASELPALGPAALRALVAIIMPILIIGGILFGVFTPTEASGVAVAYGLVVGVLVLRTLRWQQIRRALLETVKLTSIVMIVVAASAVLNWCLAYSKIPTLLAKGLLTVTDSPVIFVLIVIVVLLIVGMPLDPVPALIIMTPIILPAARVFGIDDVHLGVVMVLTLTLGLATPPIGAGLFVATAVSKVPLGKLSIAVLPFLAALLALTVLISLVPQSYTWLIDLLR